MMPDVDPRASGDAHPPSVIEADRAGRPARLVMWVLLGLAIAGAVAVFILR